MSPTHISFAFFAAFTSLIQAAIVAERSLASPDGTLVFTLERDEASQALLYSVTYSGHTVVQRGTLGLEIADRGVVADQGIISSVVADSLDTSWTDPFGERSVVPNRYEQETLTISHAGQGTLDVKVQIRVYDDGVALRYLIGGTGTITADKTSFPLPSSTQVWTSSSAQGIISRQSISSISGSVERPVLAELADNLFAAFGEARLLDSSRMKFIRSGTSTLKASLAGSITFTTNYTSPWRFVRVAPSPGGLLEGNHIMLNLCDPSEVADTSWIRPGKVLRDVTLTTQGSKACIDFAAEHGMNYVLLDAGWYGSEYSSSSDATQVNVDPARSPGPLDLPAVIAYGKHKGIGVILYVNQIALSKQLDDLLPLYQAWGVAGIKFGFVSVGSQANTRWLHNAVKKCAEHQLMVDIHDEYRPTGLSRTFPNLLTQEGIRGDEETPSNTTVLNTIFTRGLAGAGDHTPCYFASRVRTMGSHASQLAKSVCIFSPWQFLYWYDRPPRSPNVGGAGGGTSVIEAVPELEFFDRLPTTWDETRVLNGYPGSHATIARRKGKVWFLGAFNGNTARDFKVFLDFLAAGQNYSLELYRDDTTVTSSTQVKKGYSVVNRDSIIQRTVGVGSGFAAILTPTTEPLTPPGVDSPPPTTTQRTIQFETTEGYPAANTIIAAIQSDANGRAYSGTKGWSLSSSNSPGRVLTTQDSGEYIGGQALGTNGTGTYIGGIKGVIKPAAACKLSFNAQFDSGIAVGFTKDMDSDGLFDISDTGMSFGVGGTPARFQRRNANFGTEIAAPLAGSGGQWFCFSITFGTSNAGSRTVTMAVRNLTTGNDLDFDNTTPGVQAWSFNVTDAELGLAPETADGVFVRVTAASKIDDLRATVIGTPYETWMSGFPMIAGDDRSANADPDHDGIENLVEWVLDGDPGLADTSQLPTTRRAGDDMLFTFHRRKSTLTVTTSKVQYGYDLGNPGSWTNVEIGEYGGFSGGATYTVDSQGAGAPDLITVTIPTTANPMLFARLVVTELP